MMVSRGLTVWTMFCKRLLVRLNPKQTSCVLDDVSLVCRLRGLKYAWVVYNYLRVVSQAAAES